MSSGFQMSDGTPHFMITRHQNLQSQHDWGNYELLKKISPQEKGISDLSRIQQNIHLYQMKRLQE